MPSFGVIIKEAAPLTDQEIAVELKSRDIHIARRAVAKYREQLGIVCSSMR